MAKEKKNYCINGKCTVRNGKFSKCRFSDIRFFWDAFCAFGNTNGGCESEAANVEYHQNAMIKIESKKKD